MALHAALPRPALRVWWGAAAVVPLALAGLGMALLPSPAVSPVAISSHGPSGSGSCMRANRTAIPCSRALKTISGCESSPVTAASG